MNYREPFAWLIIVCLGFFIAWQCSSAKVQRLERSADNQIHQERVQKLENDKAISEAKSRRLEEARKIYTDSVKVAQRPVKIRLRANLDTIASLKSKLATRLQENPDINELVKAQDLAYSRLDSLYKGNQIAHSAEIINLEAQLKEKGDLLMIEQVKGNLWRETAQASEKDYNKERRKKGFWRTSAAILAGGVLFLTISK